MDITDLALVLETNLTTVLQTYKIGRNRVQLHLWLLLGMLTSNRPKAILGLCYRHIQVTLIRDPDGGPQSIVLEFDFEFTKQYLGMKDQ